MATLGLGYPSQTDDPLRLEPVRGRRANDRCVVTRALALFDGSPSDTSRYGVITVTSTSPARFRPWALAAVQRGEVEHRGAALNALADVKFCHYPPGQLGGPVGANDMLPNDFLTVGVLNVYRPVLPIR